LVRSISSNALAKVLQSTSERNSARGPRSSRQLRVGRLKSWVHHFSSLKANHAPPRLARIGGLSISVMLSTLA
jgi:hypothetical protein